MGWFTSGPSFNINSRQKGTDLEYYGRCPERGCDEEFSHRKKSNVEYDLKKHYKRHEEEKEKEEKKRAKAKREREEREERNEQLKKERDARDKEKQKEEKKKKEAKEIRDKLIKKRNELKRDAKGKKCPFCGKQPCSGTKPKCAMVKAAKFDDILEVGDPSDPATFDPQLKFYRDNM